MYDFKSAINHNVHFLSFEALLANNVVMQVTADGVINNKFFDLQMSESLIKWQVQEKISLLVELFHLKSAKKPCVLLFGKNSKDAFR